MITRLLEKEYLQDRWSFSGSGESEEMDGHGPFN